MFEIVTLCEANTPAVNAAVVPPADSVPVDVMVAVPVNRLLGPLGPLVAVSVKLPVYEIVTLCEASTPAVNAAVVPPADSVPVDVMVAVPVNPVTVLLFTSRAVILMLNAVPAVCVP